MYYIDGKEVIEYLPAITSPKEENVYSLRQRYLYGIEVLENIEPFTDEEFIGYLNHEANDSIRELIESVGIVLNYLGGTERMERLKSALAEFVVTELIINKIYINDNDAKRAYMYYKKLISKEIIS